MKYNELHQSLPVIEGTELRMFSQDKPSQSNALDCFPVSPMQHYMLKETMRAPRGAGTNVEQIILQLNQALDMDRFKQAWLRIIQHHEVLRIGFVIENKEIVSQFVGHPEAINIEINDWRKISKPETGEYIDTFLRADRNLGFSLTTPPLFRMALLRIEENEALLVWSFQHAIADKDSITAVLRDLFLVYHDLWAPLVPPRSFRQCMESLYQDTNATKGFWLDHLRNFPPCPALPFAAQKRSVEKNRRQQHNMSMTTAYVKGGIPKSGTQALQAFCRQYAFDIQYLLMGVWAVLLSHYYSTPDIGFGAQRSLRRIREKQTVDTGMYVNILPITIRIDPNALVSDLANQIRNIHIKTNGFINCSFSDISAWCGQKSDAPLYEVFFSYDPVSIDAALEPVKPCIACKTVTLHERIPGSLFLKIIGTDALYIELQYDRRQFDAKTIQQVLGHFTAFADAVSSGNNPRLKDISILSHDEKTRIFNRLNTLASHTRPDSCIHHLIEIQAAANKDGIAVDGKIFQKKVGNIPYGSLNTAANQLAHYLIKQGAGPGKTISVLLDQTLVQVSCQEPIAIILGILKSGSAYSLLNPDDPDSRINQLIRDTAPFLILTQSRHKPRIESKNAGDICCIDEESQNITGMDKPPPDVVTDANDLACIAYISGPGNPAGIIYEHATIVAYTRAASEIFDIQPEDRVLLPDSMDNTRTMQILFPCLFSGACLIRTRAETETTQLIQACQDEHITILILTAHDWCRLSETTEAVLIPEHVRLVIITGNRFKKSCFKNRSRVLAASTRLLYTQGPAEAFSTSSWIEVPSEIALLDHSGPDFKLFPHASFFIANHFLQPALEGTTGELYVGGCQIARGYLNQPGLTAAMFKKIPCLDCDTKFFRTRQKARLNPDNGIVFPDFADRRNRSPKTLPIILVGNSVGSAQNYNKADLGLHAFFHAPIFIHFYTMEKNKRLLLDIPQLAGKCLEHIRQFHPEGPYIIIGECQNATVAHEAACQAEAQGIKVALLVIIDENWGNDSAKASENSTSRLSSLAQTQVGEIMALDIGHIFKKLRHRIKHWFGRWRRRLDPLREKICLILNRPVPESIQFRTMEGIFYKACNASQFRPRDYNGPVLLLYSRNWIKTYAPKLNQYYTGPVYTVNVDISHDEWFKPKQIHLILDELEKILSPEA